MIYVLAQRVVDKHAFTPVAYDLENVTGESSLKSNFGTPPQGRSVTFFVSSWICDLCLYHAEM